MEALKIIAAFAAGIGCGVFGTRTYFKKKYEAIANEEIESMKMVLDRKAEKLKDKEERYGKIEELHKRKEELIDYHDAVTPYISSVPPGEDAIINRTEEIDRKINEIAEAQHPTEEDAPYEIAPYQFLDESYYDKVQLTYFTGDDVLADEVGNIDEVENSIGFGMLEAFKLADEEEMYIRNPNTGIDYCIIREPGNYHVYEEE